MILKARNYNKMIKGRKVFFWLSVIFLSLLAAFIVCPLAFTLTDFRWLLEGDLSIALVGWEFYRISPSMEPITRIANMYPDSGFYILQTDSIPWVSVLAKTIANRFEIQKPFHFIGIWLIFCWVMQGIYAGLIGQFLKLSRSGKWLLIFLFIFSPELLFRFGHFSLMAHWILLASLYEVLRLSLGEKISSVRVLYLIFLVTISFGIHPYLFAITAPILGFLIVFNDTKKLRKISELTFLCFLVYTSMTILGVSAVKNPRGTDFGACNTDLLGIFNSFGSSLFVPELRHFWCQPEGFTYFGLAFLILLIIFRKALKEFLKLAWRAKPAKYFLILCGLYIMYSLASPIRFGGNPIFYISIYSLLEPLPSIFRASGRWIWPFFYLILIAGVFVFDRSSIRYKKLGLGLLVLIHFIEFTPLMKVFKDPPRASEAQLETIISFLPRPDMVNKKMHLYPRVVSVGCGLDEQQWDYRNYALVMIGLARTGWHVDSGLGGRFDPDLVEQCKDDNKRPPPKTYPLITKKLPENNNKAKELLPGIFLVEGE